MKIQKLTHLFIMTAILLVGTTRSSWAQVGQCNLNFSFDPSKEKSVRSDWGEKWGRYAILDFRHTGRFTVTGYLKIGEIFEPLSGICAPNGEGDWVLHLESPDFQKSGSWHFKVDGTLLFSTGQKARLLGKMEGATDRPI